MIEIAQLTENLRDQLDRIYARVAHIMSAKRIKQIAIFAVLGILCGFIANPSIGVVSSSASAYLVAWYELPVNIFLFFIMLLVPLLIVASISTGIAGEGGLFQLWRQGGVALIYYAISTTLAVILAVVISNVTSVGKGFSESTASAMVKRGSGDIDMVKKHIASLEGDTTLSIAQEVSSWLINSNLTLWVGVGLVLGLMSVAFASSKEERWNHLGEELVNWALRAQRTAVEVVGLFMYMTPLVVFGSLAKLIAIGGSSAIGDVLGFVASFLVALLAMFAFYATVAYVFGGFAPRFFLKKCKTLMVTAFSSSSSLASLGVTIETAIREFNISHKVAQIVAPLGATVNMDATAIFQVMATVFIANAITPEGIGVLGSFAVAGTVVMTSIGPPGAPGVGMAILASILVKHGVPVEGIALVVAIDRPLDMIRTVGNVTGDIVSCIVVENISSVKQRIFDTVRPKAVN